MTKQQCNSNRKTSKFFWVITLAILFALALAADRQLSPVDHIVSGLPFASLPLATTRQILDAIAETLRVGGTFTTFQYVHTRSARRPR